MAKYLSLEGLTHLWALLKGYFVSQEEGKGLSANDYTDEDKTQVATNKTDIENIKITLDTKVDKVEGKSLSTNDYTTEEKEKLSALDISLYEKIANKGQPNGYASLDESGLIPSTQLPSYVDDVIEGYYNSTDGKFYSEESYTTEITGEGGKIYVDLSTNHSYRWGGSVYVQITSTDMIAITNEEIDAIIGD